MTKIQDWLTDRRKINRNAKKKDIPRKKATRY